MIKIKHYVLKRYYPEIDDDNDDNNEIVYITDSRNEALRVAAKIQKWDLSMDEEYNTEYSIIYISEEDNEQLFEEIEPPKDVIYTKLTRLYYRKYYGDKDIDLSIVNSLYDYYLQEESNDENILDHKFYPIYIIKHLKDGMRYVRISEYATSIVVNIYIARDNVEKLDEYDESIKAIAEEVKDEMFNEDMIGELKEYLFNMIDNTGRKYTD